MELNFNFENHSLSKHKNNQLNEYRKIGKFTDLKLRSTDGQIIEVHKNILSAGCPYFEGLFNSDLVETRQELIQLVDNVTIADLEIIIEYIYTGKAEVTLENAENLYIKSQYFQLTELKEFCTEILIKNMKIENCLDYWRNSVKYFNDTLKVKCVKFIQSNCKNFLENNIINLTAEEFKEIIAEKKLIIDQELLYEFVSKWVKEDFESRNIYLMELIKNLDFTKISEDFIETKIIADEILQNNKNFLTKICSITLQKMRDIKSKYVPKSDIVHKEINSLNNSRLDLNSLNTKFSKCIHLITNSGIYKLDWNEWKWTKQHNFSNRKYKHFATVASRNSIYISGGLHEQNNNESVHFKSWNYSSHKINILPQMIENRFQHKLADLNGKIYCCGGRNNKGSTEVYDFGKSKWMNGPSMNDNKYSFGLIASNDAIYTFGGFQNAIHYKMDSLRSTIVERYDPREGKWSIIAIAPSAPQAAVLSNNFVYGYDHYMGKIIFDLRTNTWTNSLADVFEEKIGLDYFSHCSDIVEFNNKIFGVFQLENSKNWGTFKYDHNADKWYNLNIPLNLNNSDDIRLCVISDA